jgi:hypothetical protein
MPITQPLSVSASDMRFSPTQRMSAIVMRSTAPVCLSPSASTIPTTITTATLRTVLPNPVSNAVMNTAWSMPGTSAKSRIGTSIAMNTCQRNFVIREEQQGHDGDQAAEGDERAVRDPRVHSFQVVRVVLSSRAIGQASKRRVGPGGRPRATE